MNEIDEALYKSDSLKRIIYYYINDKKNLEKIFKLYSKMNNKKHKFNIFVPDIHSLLTVSFPLIFFFTSIKKLKI